MEFKGTEPLYIQVAKYLEGEIFSDKYPLGTKIPGVRELSADLVINGRTVQSALNKLVDEGLLETKRGLGNFVITDKARFNEIKHQKIEKMTQGFIEESLTLVSSAELRHIFLSALEQSKGDE